MELKTMAFRHCKMCKKEAGNLKRQKKGMCVKCYDMEVLNAKMTCFFQPIDDLRSYVKLGENSNLMR